MKQHILLGMITVVLTLLACIPTTIQPDIPGREAAETANPVVARINGLEFTLAELEREFAFDRATYRLTNDKELVLQDLAGTLQVLVPTLLLDQQALQSGISATEAEITAALNNYAAGRNFRLAELETELGRYGYTLSDYRQNIARTVRIEKFLAIEMPAEREQQDFGTWLADLRQNAIIEMLYEPPDESPLLGGRAPDFTLTNLKGEAASLSQFRGRPVVLNFWATWCVPCRKEMPAFQRAYETYRDDGLVILAINFEEEAVWIEPFVAELGLTFPILLDSRAQVTKQYLVTGLPSTVFVDRQGVIQHIQVGQVREDVLPDLLEKIL